MRQILMAILGLLTVVGFQNCEPQQFKSTSLSGQNKSITENVDSGVLGIYDYSQIFYMKYTTTGGLMSVSTPELSIVPLEDGSIQASVSLVDYNGQLQCVEVGLVTRCSVLLDLNEERVTALKAALFAASFELVHRNPEDGVVMDCGSQHLKFYLKNFSSHDYMFNAGICNPDGALVINGTDLHTLLNEMSQEGLDQLMSPIVQ